jgi:AraC-like DNA-binding protein
MAVTIDTRTVPATDSLRYWMESSRAAFNPLHMTGAGRFVAALRGDTLGPLGVFRIVASASTMTRTAADVAAGDPECVQLSLVRAGTVRCVQGDRVAIVGPGQLTSYDTSAPAVVDSTGPFDLVAVRIPRALLGPAAGRLSALTAIPIPGDRGWPRLAAGLYEELAAGLSRGVFSPGDGDLVELAVGLARRLFHDLGETGHAGRRPATVGARQALHARARAFIEAHLDDPGLGPPDVARACHASVRTLHYAFADSGTTVVASIRERRVALAARDLADPELAEEPVSVIGRRWGFSSPSQFSHQFRAAHGCSPRAYREACR